MSDSFIIESEVCTEILSGLIANYMRYAMEHNIDVENRELEFTKHYYEIGNFKRKAMMCKTEQELKECQDFIDKAKKYLIQIGGMYV